MTDHISVFFPLCLDDTEGSSFLSSQFIVVDYFSVGWLSLRWLTIRWLTICQMANDQMVDYQTKEVSRNWQLRPWHCVVLSGKLQLHMEMFPFPWLLTGFTATGASLPSPSTYLCQVSAWCQVSGLDWNMRHSQWGLEHGPFLGQEEDSREDYRMVGTWDWTPELKWTDIWHLGFRAGHISTKHAALVDIDLQQWPASIISKSREDYPLTTSLHVREIETLSLQSSPGPSIGHWGVSGSEAW